MAAPASRPPTHRLRAGFTLVELLIALAIVGILTAIVLPNYLDSLRKGRRTDAMQSLAAVQQAQERYRGSNTSYASALSDLPGPPSSTSRDGYYGIALSGASATGYTVTASAVSGKSQANDGSCAQLRMRLDAGNVFYGSAAAGSSTFDEGSTNRCWAR